MCNKHCHQNPRRQPAERMKVINEKHTEIIRQYTLSSSDSCRGAACPGRGAFLSAASSPISFVVRMILGAETEANDIIFQVVEFVHFFLIGTVLYVTGIGLFQLFVKPLGFADMVENR